MSLIDRISHEPVYWAFRVLALLVLFLILVGVVYAQSEFQVTCENGICRMREADLDRLQEIITAMVNRIQELQAKTNCT